MPDSASTSVQPPQQEMRPPISCYIRTLNEERMIGRVIDAAFQVVSEVVIVDSGSTDRTREIAAERGARVIEQPWLGNGYQKRAGEEAALHDWLLDLDADEVVTPELAAEIRALFADGEPAKSVYNFHLITAPPIGEPWWRFAIAERYRLYDRRKFRHLESKAWDQLEIPEGTPVDALKSPLLHYSFESYEQFMAKWNRVSSARARDAKLKPLWNVKLRIVFAMPFYFLKHYLGRGLWRAGLYGFAVSCGAAFGRWMRDVKMYERYRRND
ncbi:MAG: glycosyltransferase family 2 protein [Pseudomonadota bacterium]